MVSTIPTAQNEGGDFVHPVWEKIANAIEKDFNEEKAREELRTRRMGFWGAILLAGLIALGGLYGTLAENGVFDGGLNHGQGRGFGPDHNSY